MEYLIMKVRRDGSAGFLHSGGKFSRDMYAAITTSNPRVAYDLAKRIEARSNDAAAVNPVPLAI